MVGGIIGKAGEREELAGAGDDLAYVTFNFWPPLDIQRSCPARSLIFGSGTQRGD